MARTRVFDGAHLRATLIDLEVAPGKPSDRLMVTLDFRRVGKNDFDPPPRSSNFARKGFAQLSIQTRANDWFVNADTYALEAALPEIVARFGEVRLLGYSMGGYGAFRFADALGAASVVAISPQVSIDPQVVPFDLRYREDAAGFDPAVGDLAQAARSDLPGLIVLDPFVRADLRHARMLQRLFPQVELARLNFGGHPAIRPLREAGRAWTIHKAAAEADSVDGTIQAAHRGIRRQSRRYWQGLASKAEARRPALAATARRNAARLQAKGGQ
ncbi:alpha/beta hydrolase [Flavimaricola marinus]|uniref:Alpha/beta hydrolase family protein n=1 Tax=Flavimaricola marinus TaxID=1819565 RepID=A0A238LGB7_9RHOB|nr:alpha/beta hydrolase [Flavimaricola marinus]SMY08622.1 hypothetical protein LOM8899_02777 [Flavimaricola marinus]